MHRFQRPALQLPPCKPPTQTAQLQKLNAGAQKIPLQPHIEKRKPSSLARQARCIGSQHFSRFCVVVWTDNKFGLFLVYLSPLAVKTEERATPTHTRARRPNHVVLHLAALAGRARLPAQQFEPDDARAHPARRAVADAVPAADGRDGDPPGHQRQRAHLLRRRH